MALGLWLSPQCSTLLAFCMLQTGSSHLIAITGKVLGMSPSYSEACALFMSRKKLPHPEFVRGSPRGRLPRLVH